MEIIQEIIGTRKKQQILNQEAKKTLHKQIKKVTHRDVSEPPPTNKAIMSNPSQLLQKQQQAPDGKTRDESANSTHGAYQIGNQQSSSKQRERNVASNRDNAGSAAEQHDSAVKHQVKQMASPKLTNSSKKQSQNQVTVAASAQQPKKHQVQQDLRVRKVRSKSPPQNESAKNPAAKIKKFYDGMIPAFTNKKRQHSFYNTAKQGFTYINWDMENELYIFQTQIEQKYRKSTMNKNFHFPKIEIPRNEVKTRGSFEGSQQLSTQQSLVQSDPQAQSKQLLNTMRGQQVVFNKVAAFSPEQVQRKSSRGVKAPQTEKTTSQDHNLISQTTNAQQVNKQVPRLFNQAAVSQNQATGELSARVTASDSKTASGHKSQYHNKSATKHQTSSQSNSSKNVDTSNKVTGASSSQNPMSKSVLKPSDTETSHEQPQIQQNQYSGKKKDKVGNHTLNQVSQTSSTNSLNLNNQNAATKQLSAMVKQNTAGVSAATTGKTQQTTTISHQSTLFSPNQSTLTRKNPKQMVQTTYVNVKGASAQKTYGLAGSNQHHTHQSQTMPNTPLPITGQPQSITTFITQHHPAHSRDQSVKSQRDVQQMQQGQSEPLFKKATTYMSRKNGQQHSVNSRMPKASPNYCTTQFNNSANTSHMLQKQASGVTNVTGQSSDQAKQQQVSSRLAAQTSVDGVKDLSNKNSGKKQQPGGSDLSMSQLTQRLNDSATACHNGNVIKFSSEYGTFNTVQLGEDMVNRSSDYGGDRTESTGRQSHQTANLMHSSGIVSPDIQIQIIEQESQSVNFDPQSMLNSAGNNTTKGTNLLQMQMPYGGQVTDSNSMQATKMDRSAQNSVQAMRNNTGIGQQNSTRLSPAAKKRNIRGQNSSQMNKTTSVNEAKKQLQKTSNNFNQSSGMKTTKNFYKTMIKPGAISSQSFIQAPDAINIVKTVPSKHAQNRFNSQTPRNIISPEHHHGIQNHKLQKTGDSKNENGVGGRGTSGLIHQTPSNKIKGSTGKAQRQQSLNSKEMFLVSKFKADNHIGPMINQYTPGGQKIAPSKAFKGSDSKQIKDFSPTAGQKNVRSRNAEAGKQTVDNVHMSSKWVDDKHQALTLKKVPDGKNTIQGHHVGIGKEPQNKRTASNSLRQQQQHKRHDTEECENFDMKDLDEREPCQSFPTHNFHSVGREGQKMSSMKVPLTTRSTHSLALNNHLKKQMTQDLNLTSPVQLEESCTSTQPGPHNNSSSQHLSYGRQQTQTQPQVMYRNEQMKLQGGPLAQPLQINSFQNLNPEYLSGDGSSHMDGTAPIYSGGGDSTNHKQSLQSVNNGKQQPGNGNLHTVNGSGSVSDLGSVSKSGKKHQQAPSIKDFFTHEEPQYEVIKEEKHQKAAGSNGTSNQKSKGHGQSSAGQNIAKNQRNKSGQLNLMARDFTMQNYQVMKNGQSTKVLNLPPKPSRNAKNNTLVLGNSTGAPTRSMQSITLSKVKNLNQQQTMQQTMVMTPKREQFTSNNLFKGFQQARGKTEKQQNMAQQNQNFKTSSFKEQKQNSQMRYNLNKTVEKKDQINSHNANNRYSIGDRGSPRVVKQRLESAKKVSKMASQESLKITQGGSHQYSMSMIGSNPQKMPQTPHISSMQNTAEKKGAKHLYMSLNKEVKQNASKGSSRDKSVSTDRYQPAQKQGGSHYHSLTTGKSREKQNLVPKQRGSSNGASNLNINDYEIVFDHLHEDSIPDNPSYDMEEQPTVVLIDDFSNHHMNAHQTQGLKSHHAQMSKHHKSKERNASLLNSSALSREQQISHPFQNSIEPMQMPTSGRNTVKEPRNAHNSEQLPKLGSTDSKLFRQSIGPMQTTPSTSGHHQLGAHHSNTSKQQTSSSTGVMKDMHSFNKQLSKKTSALKLKQGAQQTSSGAASAQSLNSAALFGGQMHQQPSITTYIAAQQLAVHQNNHQQPTLNKTQSLVSSQASLHAVGVGSGLSAGKQLHAQQQKLIKTSLMSGGGLVTAGPQSAMHQQKMLETYTKAMQGAATQGAGQAMLTQQLAAAKKTTKKSMIKQ